MILLVSTILYVRYPGNPQFYQNPEPRGIEVHQKALEKAERGILPYSIHDPVPYRYSPTVLAFSRAFPQDLHTVRKLWAVLAIAALALSLALGASYRTWRSVGLLFAGLLLSWRGILETLEHGQFEIFFMATAVLAGSLLRRSSMVSGLLVGALPWFKLPWVLLVIPFLILVGRVASPKRWRLLISGYLFGWFIWGAAVPSLAFGPEAAQTLSEAWIAILRAQPYAIFLTDANQSFWASAMRWSMGEPSIAIGIAAVFSGFLWGRFTARALMQPPQSLGQSAYSVWGWLSPWLLFVQLLDPLSWRWGSVFVVGLPFAIWGNRVSFSQFTWKKRVLAVVVLVLFLLSQVNPAVQMLGFERSSDLHGYGTVTFFWISLLLMVI